MKVLKPILMLPATLMLLLCMAPAAFAATGSFPWNASFQAGLDSRNWTQTSGGTTISAKMSCTDPYNNTYYIRLYKNNLLGDTAYDKVTYTCGTTQQYTWTGLPSGTFHFHISKATDGYTISGSGTTTYPSN